MWSPTPTTMQGPSRPACSIRWRASRTRPAESSDSSEAEALKTMRKKFPKLTAGLPANALPASFEVTANNAEDVKAIGPDVLRHRVVLSYEAEAEEVTAEDIVRRVFEVVEVP